MARSVKREVPPPPPTPTNRRGKRASADEVPPRSSATVVDEDVTMGESNVHRQNDVSKPLPDQAIDGVPESYMDNSSDTVDSDSDAGLELLGQGLKAFVTLISGLRDLGVESLEIPLPKICVLGDQSTGKSSLIEGISGIKVPRSSGTCTRCPLEINLTTSEQEAPWKCSIYLQKNYIYEGTQARSGIARAEGATRARPLGPWMAQTPEPFLFLHTTKKTDIPEALRLAQLATLNPRADPSEYRLGRLGKAGPEEDIQVKFSPNAVRLDISASDVPNLSFIDLPGVINQAEVPEEEYLVKLVANLVKSYIRNESCLNLLAMPMTDDAANCTASKLVQELNAQNRTIGVLTKPDRVQEGEGLAQWIDILNDKKFKLGHGYYVVKNNPDPRVSHSVARQEEDQFFAETDPWARTLSSHSERFGTLKLQEVLSERLTAQIRTSLPLITERIRLKAGEIVARLEELPQAPKGNLTLKVYERILAFEGDLRNHFDGGSEELPFRKEWHDAAFRFRDTIAASHPRLNFFDLFPTPSQTLAHRPSATPTPTPTPVAQRLEVIALESDDEGDLPQPYTPTPKTKRKQPVSKWSQSTQKRSRLSDIPAYTPSEDGSASKGSTSSTDANQTPYAKRFTLTDVRKILQDAHIGLPDQTDPKATQQMIKASLSGWDQPLKDFLRFTDQLCLAMILDRAGSVFGVWRGTQLFKLVEDACTSFFKDKLERQVQNAERVLLIERQQGLTLHATTMRVASNKALLKYNKAYRERRAMAFLDVKQPGWNNNLDEQAIMEKIKKISENDLGPNLYTHELQAVSHVRGYYDCAFTTFVDVIYKDIQAELFTICRNELGAALKERIGLEAEDEQRCAVLLAVDPEKERTRIELLKQKENLEKASASLESQ